MNKYYYDTKTDESLSRDRFSELPNSLIDLILSFLPMRDVVSTTFISKRWRNLWTTVPCLNFCEIIKDGAKERVRNFVNWALLLWTGTKIQKFEIAIYNLVDSSLASDMDSWVRFAIEKKVEELKIYLTYDLIDEIMENAYCIPRCLNSCSSLRKLSVVGCKFQIHGSPRWNQLKCLTINSYHLSETLINQILLGSPRLEVFELRLMESQDNLSIMSTSLKKLMIERYLYFDWDESSLYTVFIICCPNLEILEFLGGSYGKNVFTSVSSLIDSTLHFDVDYDCDVESLCLDELFDESLTRVFSTQVEKVALSELCVRWCLEVLGASPKKRLLSPNVKFLKLDGRPICVLGYMMDFLGIFPNLRMLVIEGLDALLPPFNAAKYMEIETNLSDSFLVQLKTVEITSHWSSDYPIFGFIEFFLKRAFRLEKLVVQFSGITSFQKMFRVSEKVKGMPKSSPTAKVILKYI